MVPVTRHYLAILRNGNKSNGWCEGMFSVTKLFGKVRYGDASVIDSIEKLYIKRILGFDDLTST